MKMNRMLTILIVCMLCVCFFSINSFAEEKQQDNINILNIPIEDGWVKPTIELTPQQRAELNTNNSNVAPVLTSQPRNIAFEEQIAFKKRIGEPENIGIDHVSATEQVREEVFSGRTAVVDEYSANTGIIQIKNNTGNSYQNIELNMNENRQISMIKLEQQLINSGMDPVKAKEKARDDITNGKVDIDYNGQLVYVIAADPSQ